MATLSPMQTVHLKPEDLVKADVPPMHFCGGATPTYNANRASLVWESQEAADEPPQEPLPAQ